MYTIYTGTGKHMYTNCQTRHKKKKIMKTLNIGLQGNHLPIILGNRYILHPQTDRLHIRKKIMKTLNMGLQGNHLPIMLGGGQILHPIVIKI